MRAAPEGDAGHQELVAAEAALGGLILQAQVDLAELQVGGVEGWGLTKSRGLACGSQTPHLVCARARGPAQVADAEARFAFTLDRVTGGGKKNKVGGEKGRVHAWQAL